MRRYLAVTVAGLLLLAACGGETGTTAADEPDPGGQGQTNDEYGGGAGQGGMQDHADAGCSPSGTSLRIAATNIAFDTACLAAPAGQAFTITFDNRDSLTHNLVILPEHTSSEVLFRADLVQGPRSATFEVPALEAGTYHFHCEVHPTQMLGTFIVE